MIDNSNHDIIYTIKQLKNDFGKQNVKSTLLLNNVHQSYVDVIKCSKETNIAKKLSKLGLLFHGDHKENDKEYRNNLLKKYSDYNSCTIIELSGYFRILIHQNKDLPVNGTIIHYICKDGICYRLNHWDK